MALCQPMALARLTHTLDGRLVCGQRYLQADTHGSVLSTLDTWGDESSVGVAVEGTDSGRSDSSMRARYHREYLSLLAHCSRGLVVVSLVTLV